MASLSHRLASYQVIVANQVAARDDVLDAGAFKTLEVSMRVVGAGGAGNVELQHAAVNEPDFFMPLSGTTVAMNAAGNNHKTVSNFLRFVRWKGDANVAGGPAIQIDVIAKE